MNNIEDIERGEDEDKVIKTYEDALKTLDCYELTPIKISLDDEDEEGQYMGFQFTCKEQGPYCWELDEFLDGHRDETWLIIHCPDGNVIDLDGRFDGYDFNLYGESRGDDFIFMQKTERRPAVKFEFLENGQENDKEKPLNIINYENAKI